ncbi:tRNA lysidine(34) synthetase TilS [Antarctobacter heliothermus]|uniref:tRNA(Ile)-lysidine synthase n=1 Tax=Antarctobacter heliothermus TaxID=74033 RepID=A0A239DNF2_9RHOB|nr:tRNA lysidine(34) synthetase TilS [Antarctobacter heliothermus]SNS33293.1 tRNA(Ile)-lysidine synthase [Antarctobacter heliothermus]
MGQLLGPDFPSDIGLAVSGGGDSMAMLYLAHNWTRVWGVRLHVVTVDHGFRPESADEAAMVARECSELGWPHATLRWHWDGLGNKMDAARRGRLEMIDRWRGVLGHVLMAHTRDDLAETFLMRLARGSGVEGLSAMTASRTVRHGGAHPLTAPEFDGALPQQSKVVKGGPGRSGAFRVVRPCLTMTRTELRHYLRTLQGRWVEDPSNDDPAYRRVRVRQALPALAELGLDVTTLADTAERMARARDALGARAVQVWKEVGQEGRASHTPTGEILLDRSGYEAVERDTQLRLLAAALQWVSSAEYRPRIAPLDALLERLLAGGAGTLHGCEARMERDTLRVFREFKAVQGLIQPLGQGDGRVRLWDGRWQIQGTGAEGDFIRALGEDGWTQIGEKPEAAPPFHSARSLPSLWRGDTLVACHALGRTETPGTRLWPMGQETGSFARFLLSH